MLTGLSLDEVLTRTDANGLQSMLTDALGSTIGLVNSAGSLATRYTYQPFGMPTATGGTSTNPYQFTGREFDPGSAYGSNLYYLRGRYYNPMLQRFLSTDPIGFAGGDTNLYAYVGNDPADFIDPLGFNSSAPAPSPPSGPGPNPNTRARPWPGCPGGDCAYVTGYAMVTDTPLVDGEETVKFKEPWYGKATWYNCCNKQTANLDPFDPNAPTAAVRGNKRALAVPGTYAVVINLDNPTHPAILVKINDVGGLPNSDIIIDLTPAAFKALGGKAGVTSGGTPYGTMNVEVDMVEP